ncbi:MAG: hypothetical protein KDE56_33650, partial [Anaerolineales bacterium]|nr:hypothetical protein [Anaerolineales bacterium]
MTRRETKDSGSSPTSVHIDPARPVLNRRATQQRPINRANTHPQARLIGRCSLAGRFIAWRVRQSAHYLMNILLSFH